MTRDALSSSDGKLGAPLGLLSFLAALVLAQQVGSKVVRDALFLAQASAAQLPQAFLFGALLSVPLVLGAAFLSTRIGPRRVAAACLLLNSALFVAEFVLLSRAPLATAWLVYLHVVALGGTTLSSFFSNVSELFDPHSARKASVRVTAGAAVGGALGGLCVSLIARAWGHAALLPWLAALNMLCGLALYRERLWPELHATREKPGAGLAFSTLASSSYVRSIAYLVILTQFSALLLDFNFKRQAAESLGDTGLVQLLTAFHTASALIATLVQLSLASFALERLGLAGTLSVLPLGILLGGALGPLMPRLWSAVSLRGISTVLESSLFRSAYEPLYTPLSQRARRSLKTLVDVAAGRLGETLGSLALLWIAAIWPASSGLLVRSLALGAAALSLLLSLHMHSSYIAELARSLRKGTVRLRNTDVRDSTTRLTLSQTHIEIERSQLLAEIAAQRGSQPPPPLAAVRSAPPQAAAQHAQLQAAVADLLSADRARVTALLKSGPLDVRLVSVALPLLEHAELVEPVTAALSGVAVRVTGQLVDALNDAAGSAVVRRRLPRILQQARQPMAAEALIAALRAPERILRYRATGALVALRSANPELMPAAHVVFEQVRSELRQDRDRLTLQHVFLLLSLVLEREPLWLAYNALSGSDARRRGTALEYLHSTVPEPLRSELVPWAEAQASETPRSTLD
jgi:hypothetical protein